MIEDNLRRFEKNPKSYRYKDLYRIVRNAIQTSRSMLQGFQCQGVGSIPQALEENFTDKELHKNTQTGNITDYRLNRNEYNGEARGIASPY